ncbi:MAG: hypothetical protein CL543_16130 [Alcanivorax sp.]|nr:hypothetical protein [Alcanivorax sp.]MBU60375.1 hypothetical protein [Alcanivorax sp.]
MYAQKLWGLEDKKRYNARVRRSNYQASPRLEGVGVKGADGPASPSGSARAGFRQEALASWRSYCEIGHDLTGQEAIE